MVDKKITAEEYLDKYRMFNPINGGMEIHIIGLMQIYANDKVKEALEEIVSKDINKSQSFVDFIGKILDSDKEVIINAYKERLEKEFIENGSFDGDAFLEVIETIKRTN